MRGEGEVTCAGTFHGGTHSGVEAEAAAPFAGGIRIAVEVGAADADPRLMFRVVDSSATVPVLRQDQNVVQTGPGQKLGYLRLSQGPARNANGSNRSA
jgi:hypothetical protein